MRILIVEDDTVIAEGLQQALLRERYEVDVAHRGDDGLQLALERSYALILLDVMMPGMDGWSVCRELRMSGSSAPILMLTARDAIEDRVKGLEGGADDYLPKPFDLRELLARVKALLRRETVHRTGVIRVGDLELDSNAHSAKRSGKVLNLTRREFDLLEALVRNEGRTLTRQTILERIWNNEESLENTVNFHITSLRKKVDADFPQKLIHTVHGIGYVLRRPETDG